MFFQLRPLYTGENHHPAMFHTATVGPKRMEPGILYNTSLRMSQLEIITESGTGSAVQPEAVLEVHLIRKLIVCFASSFFFMNRRKIAVALWVPTCKINDNCY